jgi:integrase
MLGQQDILCAKTPNISTNLALSFRLFQTSSSYREDSSLIESGSPSCLRPAAITVGVSIVEGQRFGLHNLRHSLSNWLGNKAKVQAKTVQSLLRHAQIKTTLGLYTQEDGDET